MNEIKNRIEPAFEDRNIPIIFSADNNYVPMMSVAIVSLVENAGEEYNYDILIFNKDFSEENKNKILDIIKDKMNFSIRFVDFSEIAKDLDLPLLRDYTIEIYFRLYIPYLLKGYQKAIYLDSDLVVTADISELWNEDLEGKAIGAVRDIGMVMHYYTRGRQYVDKTYFSYVLQGVDPNNYFNSGVLVIDLVKFKRAHDLNEILALCEDGEWYFPDQDALNILYKKNKKILSSRYNCTPENCGNRNIKNMRLDIPDEYVEEYIDSRKNPVVVHYALKEKPWIYSCKLDYELYRFFWTYACKSPFANELLEIKAKTTSMAEMEFILNEFFHDKIKKVMTEKNMLYMYQETILGSLSNTPFYYEDYKITTNGIEIDAYTSVLDEIELNDLKMYFNVNGTMYPCEIFERPVFRYQRCTDSVADPTFGKAIGFRCYIPLEDKKKKYNITCYSYINGKYIKRKYVKSSRYFPIDKKNKGQYCEDGGYLLSFNKNRTLIIQKTRWFTKLKKEIRFLQNIWKRNMEHDRKAVFVRSFLFIRDIFRKKKIWMIYDNYLTDDNGIAFYTYLKNKKRKKIIPYFIISPNSSKYQELKKDRHVLTDHSIKYKYISLVSDALIGSVINDAYRFPFKKVTDNYRDRLNRRKFVFLQHGVITDDLTKEHNKYVYHPTGFIVSAKDEYDSMLNYPYFYTQDEIWLTGLARFDRLYDNSQKYITIMPTWRKYLSEPQSTYGVVPDFKESAFYQFYHLLLTSPKLHTFAQENGYQICFKPHPLLIKCADLFVEDSEYNIKILNDYNYRQVFAESSLIISDYSSAIFDFLYLRKPIIYTHFDKEEFFANHVYDQGYLDYDKNGFGRVCYNLETTIDEIIKTVKNDCEMEEKYKRRVNDFYAFADKENCERIYKKILSVDRIDTIKTKKIHDKKEIIYREKNEGEKTIQV